MKLYLIEVFYTDKYELGGGGYYDYLAVDTEIGFIIFGDDNDDDSCTGAYVAGIQADGAEDITQTTYIGRV